MPQNRKLTMEFFTIAGGVSVHVWDSNDESSSKDSGRQTLILLHGYLETMYVFSELVDALKEKYRVITIDLPGHGLTDSAPANAKGVRINSVEFDVPVICGVLDKCKVDKAVVAGHSMGGYVALECLKDSPERFTKAIILNSHPYPDLPEKAADREREIKVIEAEKLELLAASSIPKMYFEDNLKRCDEKVRETIELCETHDPQGITASIRGLASRPDLQSVLKNPPVPVMLVHGDHDNFLPLERVEVMKKEFPEVSYVLIPGTGHNSFIEETEKVAAAIEDFLQ